MGMIMGSWRAASTDLAWTKITRPSAGDMRQALAQVSPTGFREVAGQSVNVAWTGPHGSATGPLSANATGRSVPTLFSGFAVIAGNLSNTKEG
jgi:hypothetical protein